MSIDKKGNGLISAGDRKVIASICLSCGSAWEEKVTGQLCNRITGGESTEHKTYGV
jgi:hypothetical protein